MAPVVEIKNLTYQYPTAKEPILRNLSLSIERGQFCSIIGANSGGKTTLCNAIRGFIPHFYQGEMSGEVIINGQNTQELTLGELALNVGFVFQNPFTQISGVAETVYEELAFGLENLGLPIEEIRERVERVIKLTHIEKLRERNPFELSGGQLQRVALASIIVMEPDILVIDEPTSQLDPESTEEVFEIIKLMKEKQKTIILVEHKMELIAEYSDTVILLDQGQVVMRGSCEKVLTDESVLSLGIQLPQYARLGIEMKKQGMSLGSIPVTEKQAIQELREILNARERRMKNGFFGAK